MSSLNFYYAAYSYLDEYWATDKPSKDALLQAVGCDSTDIAKHERAREALLHFAQAYSVIRTLHQRDSTDENGRLAGAFRLLCHVPQPKTDQEAIAAVESFARELGDLYGGTPLSAASKFMWLRFQHPVIIYDSLGWKWMKGNRGLRDSDSYERYAKLWRTSFEGYEKEIGRACADLIGIKRFTRAAETSDDDLTVLTSNDWFRERVFDHALVNAQYLEQGSN